MDVRVHRGRRITIGGTALAAFAAVGYFWVWPLYGFLTMPTPEDRCPGHEQFDSVVWQDERRARTALAPRGCMVDDLLARHPLRGMDRTAIVRLLGEPRPTPYFREYDLVYWLGPERGPMSIDSEWLVMRLDTAGRVSEARLVTD